MANDAQSLLAQAACYQCYASNSYTARLMQLALLKQIVLNQNAMADTSPQTLLAQAKCFECYGSNPYMMQMMELSLLVQISNNGSTGGGGGTGTIQVLSYAGADANTAGIVPADPTKDAIAYSKTGVGPTMGWNGATWV